MTNGFCDRFYRGAIASFPTQTRQEMHTNWTPRNDVADQIIQERAALAQVRRTLDEMDWIQKIAVAQIACNQLSAAEPVRLVKLEPFEKTSDYELRAVAALLRLLPPETLVEIVIEILEEPRDRNE
ncbi:hypothetical protein [Microcoleus sp. B7-D4]|uniref:hypothetical protein n=1 Tax=Microcoleus sp. B7-D4 TaxID=2818696 RepID=UPI002FD12603